MKIFVGADHNGYFLRSEIVSYLQRAGYEVIDDSEKKPDPQDDFPIFAQRVVADMLSSDDAEPRGILLCGSGQGMCMAANRFKGIRAALGYDRESIHSARTDDNANVLCLPASNLDKSEANVLIETFLNTDFADTVRYRRRIQQLDELPHS